MGKVIYNPSGKAGEYSYWAANFYNGCSANCDYCYCKKGVLSHVWSTTPTLKKSLVDVDNATEIFKKECEKNIESLRANGLFFNFNSDPYLRETIELNLWAMQHCEKLEIPVKSLTKQAWFMKGIVLWPPTNVCTGFTLTGHDGLEPGASPTKHRISAMKRLHTQGYKTWASIEPIIDFESSLEMIKQTKDFCYLYKIGLMSGKKYDDLELHQFMTSVSRLEGNFKIYWKDEILKTVHIKRENLKDKRNVGRNYKLWEEK